MSGENVLQIAVVNALRADSTIQSLLGEHPYGGSPSVPYVAEFIEQGADAASESVFPYVVVGDTTATEFDTDDVDGQEHTLTLHIWDRYRGRTRCRQVADAIYSALHGVSITVSGRVTVYCYWEFSESIPDPDVKLQHLVTRYRIVTMDS